MSQKVMARHNVETARLHASCATTCVEAREACLSIRNFYIYAYMLGQGNFGASPMSGALAERMTRHKPMALTPHCVTYVNSVLE
jgi:hypothetical protein